MNTKSHSVVAACVAAIGLAACKAPTTYEAAPLSEDVISALLAERVDVATSAEPLTLERALERLRTHGPDVQDAIARYRTALVLAEIPTPWPNPGFTFGFEGAQGKSVSTNRFVPFVDVAITIPSGDRLARQDDLNAAAAERARVEALATFRELLLELRMRLVALGVAQQRATLGEELVDAAQASVSTASALVIAGSAAALEVSSFELDLARERGAAFDVSLDVASALFDVAQLVGAGADELGDLTSRLPSVPSAVPSWSELERLVITENPALFRLRAEHAVAEQSVRLEIARQHPDFIAGTSLGVEPGERRTRYGLSLGWKLPIFDRNQQAIAQARARRDEIAVRYESAARRVISNVERAVARIKRTRMQRERLEGDVLPAARRHVDLAHRSLDAGASAALELLDAARTLRGVRADVLDLQFAEHAAWTALERAVGVPFTVFASEGATPIDPPAALRAPFEEEGDQR